MLSQFNQSAKIRNKAGAENTRILDRIAPGSTEKVKAAVISYVFKGHHS